MRKSADVGIVGAGPAGARAGELLAQTGADVLLLDPKAPWEKPCGGGLTSPLFDEWPALHEIKAEARCIEHARIELDAGAGFEVPLARPVWIVSRETLARWQLARAQKAGATVAPVKVSSLEPTRRGWRLGTDGGPVEVSALVGADGATSRVRAVAAPAFHVELVPTRVAFPRSPAPAREALVLRFYRDLVGYLWDFPRPDHRSVGIEAAGGPWPRPALDERIDEYGRSTPWPLDGRTARAGAVIGTARFGHGDYSGIAGPGFALLGDAAGLADPFTGEGIRNALRSAELFARAWLMGSDWAVTYPALARAAFEQEFAAARFLRQGLSESGLGVRIVERAVRSDSSYALAAATLGTVSVHEYGFGPFSSRWYRSLRAIRRDPRSRGAAGRNGHARGSGQSEGSTE